MGLATALAVASAVLHATWNLLLKRTPTLDRSVTSWGLMLVGGALALPVAVALGGPGVAAVPWLALSALVHVVYITALVAAYGRGDFSLAYPLARGGGALAATFGGVVLLGDRFPPVAWAGVAVAAAGLAALVGSAVSWPAVRTSLLTAAAIGTYTVVDSQGARVSVDGPAYALSSAVATAVVVSIWFVARGRTRDLVVAWPGNRLRWALGGGCSVVAYAMVLTAVRHAPVGYVAMLRESSVVLGALAGWLLLHEPLGRRRLVASAVILLGLVVLVAAGGA